MSESGKGHQFSVQFLQIVDALLIWGSFVLASVLWKPLGVILGRGGGGWGG